jgi:hypothetical protein
MSTAELFTLLVIGVGFAVSVLGTVLLALLIAAELYADLRHRKERVR